MSGTLAGRLRERVTIERRATARDALGGANGGWSPLRSGWAGIEPDREGAAVSGEALSAMPRWTVVMRREAPMPELGDRIGWQGRRLRVRAVAWDPRTPDRIAIDTEEER